MAFFGITGLLRNGAVALAAISKEEIVRTMVRMLHERTTVTEEARSEILSDLRTWAPNVHNFLLTGVKHGGLIRIDGVWYTDGVILRVLRDIPQQERPTELPVIERSYSTGGEKVFIAEVELRNDDGVVQLLRLVQQNIADGLKKFGDMLSTGATKIGGATGGATTSLAGLIIQAAQAAQNLAATTAPVRDAAHLHSIDFFQNQVAKSRRWW